MQTNLTDFQRSFRVAREAADRGESVVIEGDGKRYVFETLPEPSNPFAGNEHLFGGVALKSKPASRREKVRAAIKKKYRR